MGVAAPIPLNEPLRQRAVDACGIVTRPRNPELQRIVEEAARLARAPIAAISVVDRSRQWLAARIGIGGDEGPRAESFCGHTILRPGEPMIVADARDDRRFVANPSVLGHPHIRFYAGVPLVDHAGFALGALCVADTRPRLGLFDVYDLTHLARHAERIMAP
jgi:GAF domain-containing protein